jgi:hypothetical protein
LTPEEHDPFLKSLRRPSPPGPVRRCRAILEVAEGASLVDVARLVSLIEKHIRQWVRWFLHSRLAGLHDRP